MRQAEQTYTIQQLIDAIKQDGIPWAKRSYFYPEGQDGNNSSSYSHPDTYRKLGKVIGSACIMGVASINLGVEPIGEIPIYFDDSDDPDDENFDDLADDIITYNDSIAASWEDAAQHALMVLEPYKDRTFEATPFDYSKVEIKRVNRVVVVEGQEPLWGPE